MKKFIGVILACCIILGNFQGKGDVYAASSYIKNMKSNVNYYYDLDGDGKKEKIKQVTYRDNNLMTVTKLYINGKLKKTYENIRSIYVSIADFNKYDSKKEICVGIQSSNFSYYPMTNIFRYNKDGSYKNYRFMGKIEKIDNKTGTIMLEYGSSSESKYFKSFDKVFGGYGVQIKNYIKVGKSSITSVNRKNATVTGDTAQSYYNPVKAMKAYTSTSCKTKAFNISRNDNVKILTLCQTGGKKYVKVKNKSGKVGWVKVGSVTAFNYAY